MSKERELLKMVITEGQTSYDLYEKIKKLLTQPEQASTARHALDSYWESESYQRGYAQAELDSKREPLSVSRIEHYLERQGASFKWDDGFEAGVKWAEQQHGIGEN